MSTALRAVTSSVLSTAGRLAGATRRTPMGGGIGGYASAGGSCGLTELCIPTHRRE
jgi:hypothetical protein